MAAALLATRLADPRRRALHSGFSRIRAAGGAGGPGGAGLGPRPLLVLVDRTLDLPSSLSHPSTYSALVAETLPTSNDGTRVRVPSSSGPTVMDLDVEADEFWERAAGLPFGEAVELQCESFPARMRAVRRQARCLACPRPGTPAILPFCRLLLGKKCRVVVASVILWEPRGYG